MNHQGDIATQLLSKSGVALALTALLLNVGCGQKNHSNNLTDKKSDGVIVKVQNKDVEEVQNLFPTNKVSLINKEDGIYKVQGANLIDAQKKLPNAQIEEDKYINVIHPGLDTTRAESLEKQQSIGDAIKTLNCRKGTGALQPGIQLLSKNVFVADNIVRINSGDLVVQAVAGQGSEASGIMDFMSLLFPKKPPVKTSTVNYHWVIEAPAGSATQQEGDGAQFSITPDRAGGYLIAVIAQDPATQLCDLTGVMVGVTWDKAYEGPQGQAGTYSGAKFFHDPIVKADEAWSVSQGQGVTIAIVDSGINYNHPDLADNIKINAGEVPANQIDDDNNGYVDDVYGYDFAMNDPYPFDDESHGTHVSGLAAASNFGIAKRAKILPIKSVLATGSATTSALLAGLYYAIQQKADVINLSLGGEGKVSAVITAALQKAEAAGILIVAAAGNGDQSGKGYSTDLVESHFTQADGANILAVAATDENDQLTDYSNFGVNTVGIAAPGGSEQNPIVSTFAFNDISTYIAYPGTSMATPIVTGAAAVVKSVNPRLSPTEIKEILMSTARKVSSLTGKVGSGGVLDVAAAAREAQRRAQIPVALQN